MAFFLSKDDAYLSAEPAQDSCGAQVPLQSQIRFQWGKHVVSFFYTEHFAINIFFIKDFSSIKRHIECSAFPSDSPRVTLMDLLNPPIAAESSGEMKTVTPCLSACLFNFNPAVLASAKVVLRLWECFFTALGMSKWHLHFIMQLGKKKRAHLQNTLAAEHNQTAPYQSTASKAGD